MKTLLTSLKIFLFFTLLTGVAYPLLVTGIAQVAFPANANGSILKIGGKPIGSQLIGQQFESSKYFSSRPSASNYDAQASGGSNLGPTSAKLKDLVTQRQAKFIADNGLKAGDKVPSEMLFASGSGLDPEISPESAILQVHRIATARGLNRIGEDKIYKLVKSLTNEPELNCLGMERINVLKLNVELDKVK
jgi:potassium-transporting ATPase KdpC subunit